MKRFSIILLGALAITMAGCSKDIKPSSPDPDAWMHDLSLPVPIQFGATSVQTKAGDISTAADMVGKKFGFYAVSDKVVDLTADNNLSMPQNLMATCEMVPNTDNKVVRFNLEGGPYYYPTTNTDNYTFYGYHAHVSGQGIERASKDSLFLVVEVGSTDIMWGKASAEPVTDDGVTYEGFNARYIRKTMKQPTMNFLHLTSSVNFSAKIQQSSFAEANPGNDIVTITRVAINDVDTKAVLRLALGQNAVDSGVVREDWEGTLRLPSPRVTGVLESNVNVTLASDVKSLGSFFIVPTETISVQIDYKVGDKPFSSTYELTPTVQNGDLAGQQGFFKGYKYNYNFVVYTPERISIEATVEPYVDAWDNTQDVYPSEE